MRRRSRCTRLYASSRGDNTLAVFSIGTDGALTKLANVPTGNTPTGFTITPDGKRLIVANTFSSTVSGFHFDPQTGALTSAGDLLTGVELPAYIGFLEL